MRHKVITFFVFGLSSSLSSESFTPAMFYAVAQNDEIALKEAIIGGAKVNSRNGSGWTATHIAAKRGNIKLIRILAEAQADLDIPDDNGMTPLLVAAAEGCGMELLELLRLGANIEAHNRYGQNARDLALAHDHEDVVRLLEDIERAKKSEDEEKKSNETKIIEKNSPQAGPKIKVKGKAYLAVGMAIGVLAGLKMAQPR